MAPKDAKTIARLRELVAYLSLRKAAKAVGASRMTAWRVKVGICLGKLAPFDIAELQLSKAHGKRCRGCGDPMQVKTFDGLCVECKVVRLEREGVLRIAE